MWTLPEDRESSALCLSPEPVLSSCDGNGATAVSWFNILAGSSIATTKALLHGGASHLHPTPTAFRDPSKRCPVSPCLTSRPGPWPSQHPHTTLPELWALCLWSHSLTSPYPEISTRMLLEAMQETEEAEVGWEMAQVATQEPRPSAGPQAPAAAPWKEEGVLGCQLFGFCQRLGIKIFACHWLAANLTNKTNKTLCGPRQLHLQPGFCPRPRLLTAAFLV